MVFLVWMLLSLPGALVLGTSFDLVFDNFMKTALMSLIIAATVRNIRDASAWSSSISWAAVYSAVVITRFDLGTGDLAAGTALLLRRERLRDVRRVRGAARRLPPPCWPDEGEPRRPLCSGVIGLVFVHTGSRGGFIALSAVARCIVLRYSAIPLRGACGPALMALVLVVRRAISTGSR